jgi:hypothetical protein
VLRLLVSIVSNVFQDNFRACDAASKCKWVCNYYNDFMTTAYKEICSFLKVKNPLAEDCTFATVELELFSHLLKFVSLDHLIRNGFVVEELEKLTKYACDYPKKMYKIISEILQNTYLFHFIIPRDGVSLVRLIRLLFDGYNILSQTFCSNDPFRSCCVLDLASFSNAIHKLVRLVKPKYLNEINLRIFDLQIYLLRNEVYRGNKSFLQCVLFLGDCLESVNSFMVFNNFELENEYSSRYYDVLRDLVFFLANLTATYDVSLTIVTEQFNKCFELIENMLRFNSTFFSICAAMITFYFFKE